MAETELNKKNSLEHNKGPELLREEAAAGRERIAERIENRSPETSPEKDRESLSREAHEKAKSAHEAESTKRNHLQASDELERRRKGASTKKEQDKAFARIMDDARSHMSPPARTFSKIIHHPVVEKTSEITGKTIARPNAILSGSVGAFSLVLVTLLVARYYGYPLSGFETIAAFALGWAVGMVYDLLRVMITGGR